MPQKQKREFSIEVLHQLLTYDPDTGKLWWKVRKIESSLWSPRGARYFNSCFAGIEAGFVKKVKNRDYYRRELKLPDGRNYLAHRVIWAMMTGEWPSDMIDHENQNPLDNRWVNLRDATNSINQQNASLRKDNTSGLSGVSWITRTQRWKVDSQINGVRYMKITDCLLDAVAERMRHLRELGYHVNHGRKQDNELR